MTTNALVAPKKDGRGLASKYSDELAATIVARHASGESMRSIGKDPTMPDRITMSRWEDAGRGSFASDLARARKLFAESRALGSGDHLYELSDERLVELGKVAGVAFKARESRAAHDRWLAERLDRATWGDALKVDVSATLQIVAAFADLSRSERDGTAELDEAPMPHVVVPDPVSPDPRA